MLARVAWQFGWLFVVVLFFEEIVETLFEVIDSIFEILHLVIELLEGFVEELLEHLLHTDHHQSETIIVNVVLLAGLYGLYRLLKRLPRFFRRLSRNALASYLKYKRRKIGYWRALSTIQKLKLSAAYLTGLSVLVFWLTL
ncbi:MAG: hypothetical protein Kow0065_17250 [Methylomicrobium sp.]